MKPNTTCKKCGKEFHAWPSRLRLGKANYCSRKCSERKVTYKCKGCENLITDCESSLKNKSGKVFCGKDCKSKFRNIKKECLGCKKEFFVWKCRYFVKYCSNKCFNISSRVNEVVEYNNNNYYKTTGGYYVSRPDGLHGVMLHRQIYEDFHKIKLLERQTIHHINGIRNDNRIENLELWQNRHPKGTRVADKARVKNYCPECPHCMTSI